MFVFHAVNLSSPASRFRSQVGFTVVSLIFIFNALVSASFALQSKILWLRPIGFCRCFIR